MNWTLLITTFLTVSGLIVLIALIAQTRVTRLTARYAQLISNMEPSSGEQSLPTAFFGVVPKLAAPLVPNDPEELKRLTVRLVHAGFYGKNAIYFFQAARMTWILAALALGAGLGIAGIVPLRIGVVWGATIAVLGLVGPQVWINRRKAVRQTSILRSLPDSMDMVVVCLEAGLSLPASLVKVGQELMFAHPLMACELNLVIRGTELGQSNTEALRQFADRFDLDDLRRLAALVGEADRFGTTLAQAFRIFADGLRLQRAQSAEEMARKAAVKLLFPTILCIFPCLMIVVLGPSIAQILELLDSIAR